MYISDVVTNSTIDAITANTTTAPATEAAIAVTTSTTTTSTSTTTTTTTTATPPAPVQPSVWNTDFIDNTNASATKPIGDEDDWYVHLPIVLGICITIGAFAIILSLTCRHISHKKDKHHLNRKQNTPLI